MIWPWIVLVAVAVAASPAVRAWALFEASLARRALRSSRVTDIDLTLRSASTRSRLAERTPRPMATTTSPSLPTEPVRGVLDRQPEAAFPRESAAAAGDLLNDPFVRSTVLVLDSIVLDAIAEAFEATSRPGNVVALNRRRLDR